MYCHTDFRDSFNVLCTTDITHTAMKQTSRDTQQGTFGPAVVPVDNAAVGKRWKLHHAFAKHVADRAERHNDV